MDNTPQTPSITIQEAANRYVALLNDTRSSHTARTYLNALRAFLTTLYTHGINTSAQAPSMITDDAITWFAADLKNLSAATERLYLTAVYGYYEYLASEHLSTPNLSRIRVLIKHRSRRVGIRLPQFPINAIDELLNYAINLAYQPIDGNNDRYINLRDRAFLLTLADTGLRVHEACGLRRGDIDWNDGKAMIIGKGDRQAVVRFSSRSLEAIRLYIDARASLDGSSGRQLASLPIFARHDRGAGKKVKPITTTTGRNIVAQRVKEILGPEHVGLITPHSLRHYFVTVVLQASGNLKLAQELARHKNIAVTQRYAHLNDDELDRGYHAIFNQQK
jgi:site-specific recombinase XerD